MVGNEAAHQRQIIAVDALSPGQAELLSHDFDGRFVPFQLDKVAIG